MCGAHLRVVLYQGQHISEEIPMLNVLSQNNSTRTYNLTFWCFCSLHYILSGENYFFVYLSSILLRSIKHVGLKLVLHRVKILKDMKSKSSQSDFYAPNNFEPC